MQLHPPISPATPPNPPRSRRLKLAAAITLLFVLFIAVCLWGCVWQGGGNLGPVHANLSKIQSSDNSGFSSAISRNNDARFASRRIWLVPEGDQLLLKKIAASLQAELQKDPRIEEIRLADHWENPNAQDPGLLPDLTIRLRLSNLEEKDGLYSRSLKADTQLSFHTLWIGLRDLRLFVSSC